MDSSLLEYPTPEHCDADAASEAMREALEGFLESVGDFYLEVQKHSVTDLRAPGVA